MLIPNKLVFIGENYVVRLKQSGISIVMIAGIVMTHMELIHLSAAWKDFIELICVIILAMNGSPGGKDRNAP
jgi:hypothetical protein